jgi:GT2 family glycosyltransferase
VVKKTGVVVPTLGTRSELLSECLNSIRLAGDVFIQLVAPSSFDAHPLIASGLVDGISLDPRAGLAKAINLGIAELPREIMYATWLGDDDLLKSSAVTLCEQVLEELPTAVLVYGNCEYIDGKGNKIWENSFGRVASKIIRFGPCLIPQPGSLFRRNVFEKIGGLDATYGWAFDFDLFIRLSKQGSIEYINKELASFRWHSDSLTVRQRKESVCEASVARARNQAVILRTFMRPIEPLIRIATLHGPRLFKQKRVV